MTYVGVVNGDPMNQQDEKGKIERLVFTVEETARMLGIGRGTAYLLANTGVIPAIRLGQRRLVVPKKALEDLLSSPSRATEAAVLKERQDEPQ